MLCWVAPQGLARARSCQACLSSAAAARQHAPSGLPLPMPVCPAYAGMATSAHSSCTQCSSLRIMCILALEDSTAYEPANMPKRLRGLPCAGDSTLCSSMHMSSMYAIADCASPAKSCNSSCGSRETCRHAELPPVPQPRHPAHFVARASAAGSADSGARFRSAAPRRKLAM